MKKLLFVFLFTGVVVASNAMPGGHAHRSPAHHHGHHHHHHTQLQTNDEQKPRH